MKSTLLPSDIRRSLILVSMVFFMWGFVTWLNHLFIPQLQYIFGLSKIEESLMLFVFFGGYLIMGIPSSIFVSKFGFKVSFIVGLLTIVSGAILFYGSVTYLSFSSFLAGFFVMAVGITLLQVSANTYVVMISEPEQSASNLCLAQGINSLGVTIIPLFGMLMLPSGKFDSIIQNAQYLQAPFTYVAFFCLLLAILFVFEKFQTVAYSPKFSFIPIIKNKNVLFAALAIFFYVGAEFTAAYSLPHLFADTQIIDRMSSNEALMLFWFLALSGRLIGWRYFRSSKTNANLLILHASVAMLVTICISVVSVNAAVILIILMGLLNSVIFPVIYSMALQFTGKNSLPASGILVTAISGGGVIPMIASMMSKWLDYTLIISSLSICYLVVLLYVIYYKQIIVSKSLLYKEEKPELSTT